MKTTDCTLSNDIVCQYRFSIGYYFLKYVMAMGDTGEGEFSKKGKILSSFTHPHVVPNLCDLIALVQNLESCLIMLILTSIGNALCTKCNP